MRKPKISLPIIVEGRYDKSTLSSIFDAKIISISGFGIFNSKEKQALIRKLAEAGGIILLTDSDAGGRQIRSFLSGLLDREQIHHVYIPQIEGKEKRKTKPSKSNLLGVEGMPREILEKVLAPFVSGGACDEKDATTEKKTVTKLDFFNDSLSGGSLSKERRARLAEILDLPSDMSANALIEAINLIYGYEEYKKALSKICK